MAHGRITWQGARVAVLLGLCWLCPGRAWAYEDQLTLGLGAGYGMSTTEPLHGVLTDLAVSVGVSPVWSLRGRAGWGLHPGDEALHVVVAGGELIYLVDVLELVPYFGLGADAFARIRDGTEVDAAVHLVGGLDYLVSRDVTLELDLRAHLQLTDLDGDPIYLAAVVSTVFMLDL